MNIPRLVQSNTVEHGGKLLQIFSIDIILVDWEYNLNNFHLFIVTT